MRSSKNLSLHMKRCSSFPSWYKMKTNFQMKPSLRKINCKTFTWQQNWDSCRPKTTIQQQQEKSHQKLRIRIN